MRDAVIAGVIIVGALVALAVIVSLFGDAALRSFRG